MNLTVRINQEIGSRAPAATVPLARWRWPVSRFGSKPGSAADRPVVSVPQFPTCRMKAVLRADESRHQGGEQRAGRYSLNGTCTGPGVAEGSAPPREDKVMAAA